MDYRNKRPANAGRGNGRKEGRDVVRDEGLRPVGKNRTSAQSQVGSRARAAREDCPFLTSKEAAFYLGLAVVTLKGMRRKGTGPKCRKHGRDWRYHIEDLDAWSHSTSTGEGHD